MNFIFRTGGFICAVFFATVSLYCFTAFWSGIGSQMKLEKTMVEVSQRTYTSVSPVKRAEEDNCSIQQG